jgi:hypothetical protein
MRLKMNMTLRAERPEEIKKDSPSSPSWQKKGTVKNAISEDSENASYSSPSSLFFWEKES